MASFDAEGGLPCQIDGGLKCFGHPIGASGLRMAYEVYLQVLGRRGSGNARTCAWDSRTTSEARRPNNVRGGRHFGRYGA